jgi:hypothetical protein
MYRAIDETAGHHAVAAAMVNALLKLTAKEC